MPCAALAGSSRSARRCLRGAVGTPGREAPGLDRDEIAQERGAADASRLGAGRQARLRRTGPARAFQPDRISRAPPCMRWRGPAWPRRTGLASRPALPTPRAARRGQVPMRGTSLPAPPTFPGSPPGSTRFQRWDISTAYASAAQGPAASHFQFPAIREGIHRKRVVIRFHGGYPRVYSQSILSPGIAGRGTPGLLLLDVIG